MRGELVTPANPRYDEARRVWNGDIDRRPPLIARCADPADVAAAVGFAAERGLPVAVRGGGIVSETGVGGLTLGGGIGHLMRRCGLTAGNLVVAVPSGGWLKSSPVIPGLGLSLGTRGQTAWLTKGHPNSLAPGRRPRTTLSPTVVLRDGEPFLAFGTPGGDQQDQWTLQTFLAVAEFGLDLQAATEVPMFHIDHFPQSFSPRTARPGVVVIERSFPDTVLAELTEQGHRLDIVPEATLGKVCAAGVDPTTGFVRTGTGPRGRQAYAACR